MNFNDLPKAQRELEALFTKEELLELCDLLGIERGMDIYPTSRWMITSLIGDFNTQGVPEFDSELVLLNQFLLEAGYINEHGEEVTTIDGGEDVVKEPEYTLESVLNGNPKPPCFSMTDELDPACKRCKVLSFCSLARIALRPDCFGELFSATDENCLMCIERHACKIVFSNQN